MGLKIGFYKPTITHDYETNAPRRMGGYHIVLFGTNYEGNSDLLIGKGFGRAKDALYIKSLLEKLPINWNEHDANTLYDQVQSHFGDWKELDKFMTRPLAW